jgi:lipid IVA palmitoyltransferase
MKFKLITLLALIITSTSSFADDTEKPGLLLRMENSLSKTWDSNDYELYVTLHTWHNRYFYTQEKIDQYNENPWGGGIGKYRYDEDGDWHALYAMAFSDSHSAVQPVVGYGFEKMWRPTENVRLGAGYTVGLTMRQEIMHYFPFPMIAPIASIEYKKFALQSAYIFGGEGNGNILFTWGRWQLDN